MFLKVEVLGTDGILVKIERLPGLDEDEETCWTYFSSDKKDWEAFEVVDFLARAWDAYSVFMLEDVASW